MTKFMPMIVGADLNTVTDFQFTFWQWNGAILGGTKSSQSETGQGPEASKESPPRPGIDCRYGRRLIANVRRTENGVIAIRVPVI